MRINGEFIRAEKLGKKLRAKIKDGYDITVQIFDNFGNGRFVFEHDDYCTTFVDFSEINANDEVEIEYNKLGTIVRSNGGDLNGDRI